MAIVKANKTTLAHVAQRAGVSVATVSKVLNNRSGVRYEIRERVNRAAADCGYQRSSQRILLNLNVSRICLITVDEWASSYFYGEIFSGFIEESRRIGIGTETHLLPIDAARDVEKFKQILDMPSPESIALIGIDGPDIIDYVASLDIPAVLVNGIDKEMRINSVMPDYRHGAWLATNHLLSCGHREIIHITHPYRQSLSRKIDGFRDALLEAGIVFDYCRHVLDTGCHDPTFGARAATESLLRQGDLAYTAFFCVSDLAAIAVIQALQARGYRVPEDVSVLGFDDQPVCMLQSRPLSSVRVEVCDLGRTGLRVLLAAMEDPDRQVSRTEVSVELVPRTTVGPPPTPPV